MLFIDILYIYCIIIKKWNNLKKIAKILYYPNNIRYVMEGFTKVSFPENEILPYRDIKTDVKNVK